MSIDERGSKIEIFSDSENKNSDTKINLNGYINGKDHISGFNGSFAYWNISKVNQEYYRWDNLIHVDLIFYIDDFLFKEEFLWEKERNNVKDLKEFAISLLLENEQLNKYVNLSYELIELASEYITSRILHEINFYEKFAPYDNLKSMIYEKGYGLGINAHLLNVNVEVSLEKDKIKDNFAWDILNSENIFDILALVGSILKNFVFNLISPEIFAEKLCFDLNLPGRLGNLVSLSIRKQIKDYVFNIFRSLTHLYPNATAIKDNIYLNSLIKDTSSLKSFLNTIKQNTSNSTSLANVSSNFIYNSFSNRPRRGRGGRYKNSFHENSTHKYSVNTINFEEEKKNEFVNMSNHNFSNANLSLKDSDSLNNSQSQLNFKQSFTETSCGAKALNKDHYCKKKRDLNSNEFPQLNNLNSREHKNSIDFSIMQSPSLLENITRDLNKESLFNNMNMVIKKGFIDETSKVKIKKKRGRKPKNYYINLQNLINSENGKINEDSQQIKINEDSYGQNIGKDLELNEQYINNHIQKTFTQNQNTNKHVIEFDHHKIVISKRLLEDFKEDYDRIIIYKNMLDLDIFNEGNEDIIVNHL